MTRRMIIAGNWKMNGSLAAIEPLISSIRSGLSADNGVDIVVCPPFPYLGAVGQLLAGSAIQLGAQNLSAESSGAFTGEVSAGMLRDYNCTFVIVGHSERRTLYGETDDVVARKFSQALANGLIPILCVGETLSEREEGVTTSVIARQIDAVTSHAGAKSFANAVVAYEPVWAIGTGKNATPEQAQEVHASIRARIGGHEAKVAEQLPILYGGSMKASNADSLLSMRDIDGGLIGGASLLAEDFLVIINAGSTAVRN